MENFLKIIHACLDDLRYGVKGLLNEPKYGHLRDLHKAIKLSEPALVSSYAAVTSLGSNQEVSLFFFPLSRGSIGSSLSIFKVGERFMYTLSSPDPTM